MARPEVRTALSDDRRFEPAAPRATAGAFVPAPVPGDRFVAVPLPGGAKAEVPVEIAASAPPPPPDLDVIRQEAYERGVADGRASLPWQEAEALQRAVAALDQTGRRLAALRRSYLVENRRALVDLACRIAEQLVGHRLETRRDALETLLARALARPDGEADAPLLVRVAPEDLAVLERATRDAEPPIRFAADATLAAGDVRIETRSGDVRAGLTLALDQVRAGLEELLGAPAPTDEVAETPS
jgi:flagellar biosynthesis/type III secretory pathway protein FliH